jgi:hypothetical protein
LPFLQRKGNCHSSVKKIGQTTVKFRVAENTVKFTRGWFSSAGKRLSSLNSLGFRASETQRFSTNQAILMQRNKGKVSYFPELRREFNLNGVIERWLFQKATYKSLALA